LGVPQVVSHYRTRQNTGGGSMQLWSPIIFREDHQKVVAPSLQRPSSEWEQRRGRPATSWLRRPTA